ncbi:MAG: hypothetical protein FJ291_31375 [Planctomycetes bacterium]|nr:hypothetical protein [Planctomycetota bacterium]
MAFQRLVVAVCVAMAAGIALAGEWACISDGVLADIERQGLKAAWPGKTTGVAVDRTTGELFLAIPGLGVWRSGDKGATFARCDGGAVGGRCETGYSLHLDPNGKRVACFMLDGKSAMTLDGGKTWLPVKNVGRGPDWGAVLWAEGEPKTIFERTHENRDIAIVSQGGQEGLPGDERRGEDLAADRRASAPQGVQHSRLVPQCGLGPHRACLLRRPHGPARLQVRVLN